VWTDTEHTPRTGERGRLPTLGAGLFLLVFGLPAALFPYPVARFSERIDAIGSRRSRTRVEPTGWKVLLTRLSVSGSSSPDRW
jgi:hypothetical protein